MKTPYFSVLIDSYNYGHYVEEAVSSALTQDFPMCEREILVVDDGSTDDTALRLRRFGNAIHYLRKANGGQASAFNYGFAHARGEVVTLLDADDVEADEFLATLAVALSGCIVLNQPLASYRFHSQNQFQFSVADPRRLERRFISLDSLAKDLPPQLSAAGVVQPVVEFLTLPNWIDATRTRLALGRGWPWETASPKRGWLQADAGLRGEC